MDDVNCFICFEDISDRRNILEMTECGCKEYVHPECIGMWIETNYRHHIRNEPIRCPICNTYGIIEKPEPIFRRTRVLERLFDRIIQNREEILRPLIINQHNIQIGLNRNPNQEIDIKRFIIVTCTMFSIGFILIWILYIQGIIESNN